MRWSSCYRRASLLAIVCLLSIASAGFSAAPDELQLSSATAQELWRKGSDQILAGDFAAASHTLEQVAKLEPNRTEVRSVLDWMKDAKSLAESRERLRTRNYDYFVAEARKSVEYAKHPELAAEAERKEKEKQKAQEKAAEAAATSRPADSPEADADEDPAESRKQPEEIRMAARGVKPQAKAASQPSENPASDEAQDDDIDWSKPGRKYQWSRALHYSQSAFSNCKDENEFREQAWFHEVVHNVLVEIDDFKSREEWRDALYLYDVLRNIFPHENAYEEGFVFCRKRAHLDFVYGPKSTWQQDLRNVDPDVLEEILERIDKDYVESVDFKKLCSAGIEHLLILAEAEPLAKTFPSLADQDLVEHFTSRLRGLLEKRVKDKRRFESRHVGGIFESILAANRDSLRLPENVVVDEFVAGLLEPLDEFTAVIWPSEVDEFNKHTRGEFPGVGIQITQDEGAYIRVESPLEDSPAYDAGIKPGDFITSVDGKDTREITIKQAVDMITGEPGSKVVLKILDPATKQERELALKRTRIKVRTVRGHDRDPSRPTGWNYLIDPASRIGYVRVSGFMDKTVDDLSEAIKQMRIEGCRGLILDLRFNPGGLLTSARDMCELFLDNGDPIVMTKGRNPSQNGEIHSRSDSARAADWPLIILVNDYSASASEIVAGALSGLKHACVVGSRTFGKGSVQNLIPIADGAAYLKLTTAYYYVPDKDLAENPWYLLHRKPDADTWGVEPHVACKVIPQEVGKILRLRRERDVLKGKNQDKVPLEILERQPTSQAAPSIQEDEDPNTDPQIVAAVNLMRVKLLSNQPWAMTPRQAGPMAQAPTKPVEKDATAESR